MITNALIATSGTDALISPGNIAVVLVSLCNSLSSTVTVNMYVVPNGGTASITNKVLSSRELQGNDSLFLDTGKFLLSAGDKITLTASSNNAVGATISYITI